MKNEDNLETKTEKEARRIIKESIKEVLKNVGGGILIFGTIPFLPFVGYTVLSEISPNYLSIPEIIEKRKIMEKCSTYQEVYKYDTNKDGVLDSTEFLNYYNKEKK